MTWGVRPINSQRPKFIFWRALFLPTGTHTGNTESMTISGHSLSKAVAIIGNSLWGGSLYDIVFWLSIQCLGELNKFKPAKSFPPTRSSFSGLKTPHWEKTRSSFQPQTGSPQIPWAKLWETLHVRDVIRIFWYPFPGRLISPLWGGWSF